MPDSRSDRAHGTVRHRCLSSVVDAVSQGEIVERLLSARERPEPTVLTYVTAWSLVLASRRPSFARRLADADLVYSDGMGVVLALLLTRGVRCTKITAGDFFLSFARQASERELRVVLVGGRPRVMERALEELRRKVPDLHIPLARHGYLETHEEEALVEQIHELRPDVVVLGMGQPRQEELAARLRERLRGAAIWCVGGYFDELSRTVPVAPGPIRSSGLEWAYRLVTRPRQMWKRYFLGLPYLAALLCLDVVRATPAPESHSR